MLGLVAKAYLSTINRFQPSVAIIQKPIHWFAVQINWLVSIWSKHKVEMD